ncbi:hypothetical protein GX586_03420 [bacterium]|nr:hypothetical protein [bacterium]
MPCLFALGALILPRGMIIVLWLFTGWFAGMFRVALWPVLGFVFLPTTLLWYSAVFHWYGGEWHFPQILGLIVAVMIDVSPATGRRNWGGRE